MKKNALATALFLFFLGFVHAQQAPSKRIGKLENRVGRVEKRVTRLEETGDRAPAADRRENLRVQPLTVTLISKKHAVTSGQLGMNFVLEFKNLTSYDINGFSGTLVFKPEGGDIYTRRMSYSHLIESGDIAQIEITVSSDKARQYLKFIKAKAVKVVLINQKLF
jgi:hypothetical protein